MKSLIRIIVVPAVVACLFTACTDRQEAERKAREDAEAKARAEASRKEMEKLPETFKPRYNQKLTPEAPKSSSEAENKSPPPGK